MKKLLLICLSIILLLSACHTPPSSPEPLPITLPTVPFSGFALIRLTPTALPISLSKQSASKKSAAQLDRELVIRLCKKLQKQKIAPTNDTFSTSMINIIPHFEISGQGLVLVVTFQDNASKENLITQTFTVANTWKNGFKYSEVDRASLAALAQQVVNYMLRLQSI
jgi:hypothetical protein